MGCVSYENDDALWLLQLGALEFGQIRNKALPE
jgi:hypothetical protein